MKCRGALRNRAYVIVLALVALSAVFSLSLFGCTHGEGDAEEGQYDTAGGYYDHMCFDQGRIIEVDFDKRLLLIETLDDSNDTPSGTQVLLDYSGSKDERFVRFDNRLTVGAVVSVAYFPYTLDSGGYDGTVLKIVDAR